MSEVIVYSMEAYIAISYFSKYEHFDQIFAKKSILSFSLPDS